MQRARAHMQKLLASLGVQGGILVAQHELEGCVLGTSEKGRANSESTKKRSTAGPCAPMTDADERSAPVLGCADRQPHSARSAQGGATCRFRTCHAWAPRPRQLSAPSRTRALHMQCTGGAHSASREASCVAQDKFAPTRSCFEKKRVTFEQVALARPCDVHCQGCARKTSV